MSENDKLELLSYFPLTIQYIGESSVIVNRLEEIDFSKNFEIIEHNLNKNTDIN